MGLPHDDGHRASQCNLLVCPDTQGIPVEVDDVPTRVEQTRWDGDRRQLVVVKGGRR